MARLPPEDPRAPAAYDRRTVAAFQALARGEATADQQVYALKHVVEEICKTYDLSYRPASDRDTVFAEGKRFVGLQIVKFITIHTSRVKEEKDGRSHRGNRDPDRDPKSELRANERAERTERAARGRAEQA